MAQEMESFALVMRLAQQENLPPRGRADVSFYHLPHN